MSVVSSDDEWRLVLAQGETTHVDFKAAMRWEGLARAALCKDIVAMANVRDGGVLVIGVSERDDGNLQIDGVTPDEAASFDPTKVIEYISSRFQPPVRVQIERPALDGKQLIAIRVIEFETTPIVCTADGPELTQGSAKRFFYEGNIFVRTAAAKTEVIRRGEDMQALIRLAVSKTSDQLLADFRRILAGEDQRRPAPVNPHTSELEVWSKELDEHRAKWVLSYPGFGTFTMLLLPSQPVEPPLDHAAMRKLVEQSQVQRSGWKLPSEVWSREFAPIQNRIGALQGSLALERYRELWQMRDTGAFMYARLLRYAKQREGIGALPFEDVITQVVLGVNFAQRLYERLLPEGYIEYEFALVGVKDQRVASFDEFRWGFDHTDFRAAEHTIPARGTCTVLELRSAWRGIVRRVVKDLFTLFSWDIELSAIDHQIDRVEGRTT